MERLPELDPKYKILIDKKVINENLIKADILSRALLESWDSLNYELSFELIMYN
jgi:hypothetical protein